MITQISYNVLIERFRAFASGHYLIEAFTHGELAQTDLEKEQRFPWMHVFPVEVEPRQGSRLYTFVITFADLPRDKETDAEYQRESLSDCIKLAEDLLAEIQNGLVLFGPTVELEGSATIEPFIKEFTHTLTGVNLTLTISVPWDWSACDIPADWTVGGSGSGGSGSGIGLLLQTNGVDNGSQSLLNLQAGTNVTITDNGSGTITISASGGGGGSGTVTSVGLSAPPAFTVSGSPVTTSGTLALGAAGDASEYIDGSGNLQTFPIIPSPQDLQGVTNIGNETTNTIIVKNVFGVQVKTAVNQVLVDAKPNGAGVEGEINIYSTTGFDPATTYKRTGVNNMLFPTSGSGTFALSVNGVTPNAATGDITISTGGGSVTSVGLTMPSAFAVSGSPITTAGTLAVTGAGNTGQYIRGDGTLANFPATGGGGGQVFYFNGNVSQGTIGGTAFYELGTEANTGPAANFTRATTGVIASFITDVNSPNHLIIPAGVWTVDVYLSETGGGSNNAEIIAVLKVYNGSTFTTIASSPLEQITNGNVPDLYTFAISVPNTVTAASDRVVIEFDIQNTNGKTVTLYTEDGKIGEVHSTYAIGLSSLNGLTDNTQTFATGTAGTDFAINSAGSVHTFDLPTASATNRGLLSSADWTSFNAKKDTISFAQVYTATVIASSTVYAAIGGIATYNGTESNRQLAVSVNGIIKDFYASISTIQSATGSLVINVRKNGVNTGITVTFTNADGATAVKSDTVNTVSVSAGDKISFQLINGATAASAQIQSMSIIIERT